MMDAKKTTLGEADALRMLQGIDQLYVAKGKKIVHMDLKKTKPALAEVAHRIPPVPHHGARPVVPAGLRGRLSEQVWPA